MKWWFILFLVFIVFVASCTNSNSKISKEVANKEGEVPLDEIISGGPPKDGIPPIDNPKFVSVTDAKDFVEDSTLGILIKLNEDIRFYPYNILVWHEIVNDEVGGKPLSITFCPLCATGIVFEREVDSKILDFGTSGKLYQSNLVMYDRQSDTFWSQAEGRAIRGELFPTTLTRYPSSIVEFSKAAKLNPNMKVLSTKTGYVRDYKRNPYQGYENTEDIYFPINHPDRRLPAKLVIYGISVDGKFKAYDYLKLIDKKKLEDTLNGHKLEISVSLEDEIVVFDNTANKRIVGFNSFWFSFATHNPDAEIWTG